MGLGTITVLDDIASVGPVKHTRVSFAGDSSYPTGGSLGFAAALSAAVGEDRTIVGVNVQRGQGGTGVTLEYRPAGKEIGCTVVPSSDVFTANAAHGFAANDPVQFFADDLGDANQPQPPSLPAGVAAGTTYYVIASGLTTTAFKVSATRGGSTIDVTALGTGKFAVQRQDVLQAYASGSEEANATNLSADTFEAVVTSY